MKKSLIINFLLIGLAFFGVAKWVDLKEFTFASDKKELIKQTVSNFPIIEEKPIVISSVDTEEDNLEQLKQSFANKYNMPASTIFLNLDVVEGSYAKGTVDFNNAGNPANFFAYKGDTWVIVAVENGVVSCDVISGYSFPSSIIPQCYSISAGSVVSR